MDQPTVTKKCSNPSCSIKPITDFHKCKRNKDGLQNRCKFCRHQHYIQNSTFNKQTSRNRYWKNPTKARKQSQIFRQTHPESRQQWLLNNPNYQKEWALNNPQKIKIKFHKWYVKNPQYYQNRYNHDLNFKIVSSLRSRLFQALKNNQKTGHTINLLMCSISEWRKHLESLWTDGMSWSNYGRKVGQWSVDHIIPCSFFDMSDPVEQYMCCRWQNTQPMWHISNLKKSNKIHSTYPLS